MKGVPFQLVVVSHATTSEGPQKPNAHFKQGSGTRDTEKKGFDFLVKGIDTPGARP